MCTVAAALQGASAVVGFVGQANAANAYNEAALQNAQNAGLAAQRKYDDEQRKFIYDSKVNQKEGYEAALKGRATYASGVAQAGASGFDVSSLSVEDILAAERQRTAENLSRVDLKQDDLTRSYLGKVDSYEAEAQNRINSMPMKEGPNPLGLAINLGTAALGGYNANPKFESKNIFALGAK